MWSCSLESFIFNIAIEFGTMITNSNSVEEGHSSALHYDIQDLLQGMAQLFFLPHKFNLLIAITHPFSDALE